MSKKEEEALAYWEDSFVNLGISSVEIFRENQNIITADRQQSEETEPCSA